MIIKSHWRRIKHDYLHQINRPRIDLVVSILTSRVIPQAIEKMSAVRSKNHRKATAIWRKGFSKQWDELQDGSVESQDLLEHHTHPLKWTCVCKAFLHSRFLLCKHTKPCFEKISDRPKFFLEFNRQRSFLLWVNEQLILRSNYQESHTEGPFESEEGPGSDDESEFNTSVPGEVLVGLEEERDNPYVDNRVQQLGPRGEMLIKTFIVDILNQQESIGNIRFLEVYFEGKTDFANEKIPHEEIQRIRRQPTMPINWARYKHAAAAYYK